MFVTTAGRTNEEMIEQAKQTAKDLHVKYIARQKRSIKSIQQVLDDDCIVVGKERLELYPLGENEPFFFHPNSAMFRIKRLLKGEHDPFLEAAQLKHGMSFLDCTLGLASDSIIASYAVGEKGVVTGVEANPYLAYIVEKGLNKWKSGLKIMDQAMKRIKVVSGFSKKYLQTLPDESYDVVYFDPMFEENILESDGIKALTKFAVYDDLDEELMKEAIRVARKRVVLKDHFRSTRFEKFGFHVYKRKTAKFHFGVIDKQQNTTALTL
jgi:16S rRNA G966 N2-methylase RsmD